MLFRSEDSRMLYSHQVEAIKQFVQYGTNIVVASGTGSGKTETFLLPIIDRLLKEGPETRQQRGIRAILLYPMNALVNDQIKRLTGLLLRQGDVPNPIRFGYYTSATEKSREEAKRKLERDLENDERLRDIVRDALGLPAISILDNFKIGRAHV